VTSTLASPSKRAPLASAICCNERFIASTLPQAMDLQEVNEHNE
jgi:hypothetical protein